MTLLISGNTAAECVNDNIICGADCGGVGDN